MHNLYLSDCLKKKKNQILLCYANKKTQGLGIRNFPLQSGNCNTVSSTWKAPFSSCILKSQNFFNSKRKSQLGSVTSPPAPQNWAVHHHWVTSSCPCNQQQWLCHWDRQEASPVYEERENKPMLSAFHSSSCLMSGQTLCTQNHAAFCGCKWEWILSKDKHLPQEPFPP